MDIIKHANKTHDMDHVINTKSFFKHKMKNNNKFASDCIWEIKVQKGIVIFVLIYIIKLNYRVSA
jgi:hypothetical protein